MNKEPKKIFREKSLERVSSPEQLNNYIKVVNVGVWVIISAIAVLLIGVIIWFSVISLETETVNCAASVKNQEVVLYFDSDERANVKEGMIVHIGDSDFELPELEIEGVKLYSQTDSKIMEIIGDDGEDYVCAVRFYADLPNGIYESKVVSSDINPLDFLIN